MQTVLRNLLFALRMMNRNMGLTVAAVLTLALGIGANSAIFTVTNALLLKPFPYRDPSKLVSVEVRDQTKDRGVNLVRYESVRDRSKSFEGLAVWANDNLNLTGNGEPVQISIARVSPNFFSMLGVQPELGRTFTEEEGRPEGKPVVMLSDSLWRTRYHGDPAILGQTIQANKTSFEIVGVAPPGFFGETVGEAPDLWIPITMQRAIYPGKDFLSPSPQSRQLARWHGPLADPRYRCARRRPRPSRG